MPRGLGIRAAAGAAALLAVGGGSAVAAHSYLLKPSLGMPLPHAGAAVNRPDPVLRVAVTHPGSLGALEAQVDGRPATGRVGVEGGAIVVRGLHLADGRHTVLVRADAGGLFGGTLHRRWAFTVDTTPPPLRLAGRPGGWVRTHAVTVEGQSQPGAALTGQANAGAARLRVPPDGRFRLAVPVGDGDATLAVTAADAAGNRTTARFPVRVDATPPVVTTGIAKHERSSMPVVTVHAADRAPTRARAWLDGKPVTIGRRVSHPLAEGHHALTVTAVDAAGNRAQIKLPFVVDSTEQLKTATLVRGAVGHDVVELQDRLRRQGFLRAKPTGVFGGGTWSAVRRFQRTHGLAVDGVVGPLTIGAMSGHIVIDQSSHRLTLFRFGHAPVAFGVAVGQTAYPTPNGRFSIVDMVENPTWVPPPDAPWAQGALPVPPGPNNPLGTRWMGLSAPGVGIHGTDDPSSIGYSVSHGCIRMQTADAERLFRMVTVGMTVDIHP